MKNKILLLSLLFSSSIYSQTIEPIQADRPDQTETPAIVPKDMFQVETGFTFQKNDAISKSFTLPSTLWKYGVNENFELRLITEFSSEETNNEKINGLSPIYIGFKVKLAEEKGIVPKTSFIGHISLPNMASTKFKTEYFAPEFRFVMQHTLSDKISFSYNLGAEWDGFSAEPTFIYTNAIGYSISDKLGSYFEIFGFIPQNTKSNHSIDGGITYLISNNFMVDLSSGFGISKNAPDYYCALGFSFRI
ncbi:MAG: transporter [Flavobacterium sp.]|uniref:transporter n=1 Tax=Flavobacterium sp. TaxID=239 RepID=UPI0022CCA1D5|nr:transporter [Flavobacterium sp.]MCZ8196374.1 transporter [Flavobacterium sp.]